MEEEALKVTVVVVALSAIATECLPLHRVIIRD